MPLKNSVLPYFGARKWFVFGQGQGYTSGPLRAGPSPAGVREPEISPVVHYDTSGVSGFQTFPTTAPATPEPG